MIYKPNGVQKRRLEAVMHIGTQKEQSYIFGSIIMLMKSMLHQTYLLCCHVQSTFGQTSKDCWRTEF